MVSYSSQLLHSLPLVCVSMVRKARVMVSRAYHFSIVYHPEANVVPSKKSMPASCQIISLFPTTSAILGWVVDILVRRRNPVVPAISGPNRTANKDFLRMAVSLPYSFCNNLYTLHPYKLYFSYD